MYKFDGKDLTAYDVTALERNLERLEMHRCTSSVWKDVGEALAGMTQLRKLVTVDCNSGDHFCKGLRASASLEAVDMGS